MLYNVDFFRGLKKLFTHHHILSISGESGTGKTTLALQIVGTLLTYEHPFQDSCIWVQASELFSLKRLNQLFQERGNKLEYVKNSFYVIPQKIPIQSYEQQASIFQNIFAPNSNIPPNLKYIIIDNISHHLRYKISQFHTIKDISSILDTFYEAQLMPLISFCKQNRIMLILIHEVSYSLKDQCNRPFFYKLYDRIKTIDIVLNKVYHSEKKNLQIYFNKLKWTFQFTIETNGILFI
ncbi:MAG: NB-ARC domain-containing protein [Promethearchaeota archaeon]